MRHCGCCKPHAQTLKVKDGIVVKLTFCLRRTLIGLLRIAILEPVTIMEGGQGA